MRYGREWTFNSLTGPVPIPWFNSFVNLATPREPVAHFRKNHSSTWQWGKWHSIWSDHFPLNKFWGGKLIQFHSIWLEKCFGNFILDSVDMFELQLHSWDVGRTERPLERFQQNGNAVTCVFVELTFVWHQGNTWFRLVVDLGGIYLKTW